MNRWPYFVYIMDGPCVQICPQNALSLREAILEFNQERCSFCLQCVDACPAEAIERAGKRMIPGEVSAEVINTISIM